LEELLSYRLEDLILFSLRSFNRMFQMYADEMLAWNLVLAVAGTGLFLSVAIWKQARLYQLLLLYLAVCWGYVGGVFLKQYYLPLNPLLSVAVYAFYAQAVALFCYALYRQTVNVTRVQCILAGSLVLITLAGITWSIPFIKPQLLGAGPDSLMLLTLLTLRLPARAPWLSWLLYILPLAWITLSFLTLLGLENLYIAYGVFAVIFCGTAFIPRRAMI